MLPGIRLSLGNSAASQRAVAVSDIHQDPRTKQEKTVVSFNGDERPTKRIVKKAAGFPSFLQVFRAEHRELPGTGAWGILLGAPGEETACTSHGSRSASIAL